VILYAVGMSILGWPAAATHQVLAAVTTVWAEPTASREIDAAMIATAPRPERWLSALGTPERLDLLHRVNTQALLGEPVIVIGEHDGWSEVRLPWQPTSMDAHGYPGWIRSAHLTAPPDPDDSPGVQRDRLRVQGASVSSIGSVMWHGKPEPDPRLDMQRLLAQAVSFLGVEYLWGGLSGWGVDCSGLVHLCARSLGLIVPRDSGDQFAAAEAGTLGIPADAFRWFRHPADHERAGRIRHVGFALEANRILHAPRTGFVVEVVSADEEPYRSDATFPEADAKRPSA
jgi:gamma-D-glutamyl-L-lysine dipeptidyl-peptidase